MLLLQIRRARPSHVSPAIWTTVPIYSASQSTILYIIGRVLSTTPTRLTRKAHLAQRHRTGLLQFAAPRPRTRCKLKVAASAIEPSAGSLSSVPCNRLRVQVTDTAQVSTRSLRTLCIFIQCKHQVPQRISIARAQLFCAYICNYPQTAPRAMYKPRRRGRYLHAGEVVAWQDLSSRRR